MKAAAALVTGALVLLAGLALGFVAARQLGGAPTNMRDQQTRPADQPLPEVAEALVGKWRLQTVNGVQHRELDSKEWYGPSITEFGPDGHMFHRNWHLVRVDVFGVRLNPAGTLAGTYEFLDDEHILMTGKFEEKDHVRAALAQKVKPVKWVARIKSISERSLTLVLFPDYEANYSRTNEEELLKAQKQVDQLKQDDEKDSRAKDKEKGKDR